MSKVTVAKSAGFCFGVDRAVKMVYGELEKNTNVATLGPIIHNQDVVNDMQAKGARTKPVPWASRRLCRIWQDPSRAAAKRRGPPGSRQQAKAWRV